MDSSVLQENKFIPDFMQKAVIFNSFFDKQWLRYNTKLSSNFAQNFFLIPSSFESLINPFLSQSVLFAGLKIVDKIDGVICNILH